MLHTLTVSILKIPEAANTSSYSIEKFPPLGIYVLDAVASYLLDLAKQFSNKFIQNNLG